MKNQASWSPGVDVFLVVCSAKASNDTEYSAVQNVPVYAISKVNIV